MCLGLQDANETLRAAQRTQLAVELMKRTAMDELRTKQQLGYTVQCLYTEHAGACHLILW